MTSPLEGRDLVVTGVDGFVGRHVARLARAAGARVHGLSRSPDVDDALSEVLDSYQGLDLRAVWPQEVPADAVIHLAGRSAVGPSFRHPQDYIADNSAIVTTMCESLLARGRPVRVVGVSSGAVYASPADGTPVGEDAPTAASSPYAVSKLLVERQLEYYRSRGLDTIVARPFNHIGPGQGPGFLIPDLAMRLRTLPDGEALTAGNLDTARDYTDVRDVAQAYLDLAGATAPAHDVYNVAQGSSTSGRTILELLCAQLGRAVPPAIVDPALIRPGDPLRIAGSADRLREDLGWAPRHDIRASIAAACA